jgi:Ni,Fe-hydrogenase maturation factor
VKVVSEIKTVEIVTGDTMPQSAEVKTNVRVLSEKYELLKDIKSETGIPINALIAEGIDLVLVKYEDELLKAVEKAQQKANAVESVLTEIKKDNE